MFSRSYKIVAFRLLPAGIGARIAFESPQLQEKQIPHDVTLKQSSMSKFKSRFNLPSLFHQNNIIAFCDETATPGPIRKSMLKYPNGDVYIGEVRSGLRYGHGVMTYGTTKMVYIGEWIDGHMHGNGIMKYADGSIFYEGEWRLDGRDGFGVWTDTNGDVYTGEFKNNKRHGKGVMKYNDGRTFEGEWREGRKRGRGTMTYANGDVYTGKWKKGEKVFSFTAGVDTGVEVGVENAAESETQLDAV